MFDIDPDEGDKGPEPSDSEKVMLLKARVNELFLKVMALQSDLRHSKAEAEANYTAYESLKRILKQERSRSKIKRIFAILLND